MKEIVIPSDNWNAWVNSWRVWNDCGRPSEWLDSVFNCTGWTFQNRVYLLMDNIAAGRA